MGNWRLKMLLLRNGVYTYRKVIPPELRPFMKGKREVWRSLQTGDLETAKLRAMETGLEVERQLHEARRRLKMRGSVDPETLAQDWTRRELAEEAKLRRESGYRETDDDLEALGFTISDHKEALSLGDTSLVERLLDRVLGEYGVAVPLKDRQRFALALLKARLKSFEVSQKWAEAGSPEEALMVSDLLERTSSTAVHHPRRRRSGVRCSVASRR